MNKFNLLFIAIFGLFLFLARQIKYNSFHKANIEGPINRIYRNKDYVMIYINKVEYRIIPVSLYSAPRLDIIAKKGDSVFKRPNSDTLMLKHESDEAFHYIVKKW